MPANWIRRFYRRDGTSGLEIGKRGRRAGDHLMLTASEARRAQSWITSKCPDQMQLPFALWTAQAARELIHEKFGKTLGLSTMPLYLKRWGFTSQKPRTRATQRDPQKIAAWLDEDYPSIAARAKREKAAIHWSGEGGVRDQDQGSCTGGPDAGFDTDQAKILDEHDRRREQSRPHAVQAL